MSEAPIEEGAPTRAVLLATYFDVVDGLARVQVPLNSMPDPRLEELERSYFAAQSRIIDVYLDGLVPVALSRCPFSDAPLEVPLDTGGLDGPWWDYQGSARPWWERPSTLVSFTGAMRLGRPLENSPWLACPGPGVPYVQPRLLADTGVRAVVSTVPVGVHTGYVIAYFAATPPVGLRPANDWGAPENRRRGPDGGAGWDATFDDASTFDFDLEPWVEAGRLLWIAPGDRGLTLRSGLVGCPYLSLQGPRSWQRIQEGEVW